MNTPLHIAFGVNDAYIPYICVTIKSIVENNKNNTLHFHVLSDYISKKMISQLNEAIEGCNTASITIHHVENALFLNIKSTWSVQSWYRVLLPKELESVHRVLYLDADTIITGSLCDLFSIDMTEKSIAAVLDIESFNIETFQRCGYDYRKKYICAGVLLMNLDYWREHNLTHLIIEWARKNSDKIKFPDQDCINYMCQDTKILLPLKYGILNEFFYNEKMLTNEYLSEVKECILNPVIIHYAGCNPWKIELARHIQNNEWNKYNKLLKHPAKRHYVTKGFNLLKLHVWNFLHCGSKKVVLTKQNQQLEKILNI